MQLGCRGVEKSREKLAYFHFERELKVGFKGILTWNLFWHCYNLKSFINNSFTMMLSWKWNILEKDYSGRNGLGPGYIHKSLFVSILVYGKSNQLFPSLLHSFLTVSFSLPAGSPSPSRKVHCWDPGNHLPCLDVHCCDNARCYSCKYTFFKNCERLFTLTMVSPLNIFTVL